MLIAYLFKLRNVVKTLVTPSRGSTCTCTSAASCTSSTSFRHWCGTEHLEVGYFHVRKVFRLSVAFTDVYRFNLMKPSKQSGAGPHRFFRRTFKGIVFPIHVLNSDNLRPLNRLIVCCRPSPGILICGRSRLAWDLQSQVA